MIENAKLAFQLSLFNFKTLEYELRINIMISKDLVEDISFGSKRDTMTENCIRHLIVEIDKIWRPNGLKFCQSPQLDDGTIIRSSF